jgi:ABC-2 type transport system ATP-binding protein
MIDALNLTKKYGEKTAVDDLTFQVKPGIVTGFLGPNGSGKSTTMRLILGLDGPTSGEVTVNGKHYRDHPAPLHEVGVLRRSHRPLCVQPFACARPDPRDPTLARRLPN